MFGAELFGCKLDPVRGTNVRILPAGLVEPTIGPDHGLIRAAAKPGRPPAKRAV